MKKKARRSQKVRRKSTIQRRLRRLGKGRRRRRREREKEEKGREKEKERRRNRRRYCCLKKKISSAVFPTPASTTTKWSKHSLFPTRIPTLGSTSFAQASSTDAASSFFTTTLKWRGFRSPRSCLWRGRARTQCRQFT